MRFYEGKLMGWVDSERLRRVYIRMSVTDIYIWVVFRGGRFGGCHEETEVL